MKAGNNYLALLRNFTETPKAVYAAVCVSLANRLGADFAEVERMINEEWAILHEAEIVPQKPLKSK